MSFQSQSKLVRMSMEDLLKAKLKWNPQNRTLPKVQKHLIQSIMKDKLLDFIQVGCDGLIGNGHRRLDGLYHGMTAHYSSMAEDDPRILDRAKWVKEKVLKEEILVQKFAYHTAQDIYKIVNSSLYTKVTRSRDRLESFAHDYDWDVLDNAAQKQFSKIAVMFELGISLVDREIADPDYSIYSDHREPSTKAKEGFEKMLELKIGARYVEECHGFQRYITPDKLGSRSTGVSLKEFTNIVYKTGYINTLRFLRQELNLCGRNGYFPHDERWDAKIVEMFEKYACKYPQATKGMSIV